MKVVNLQTVFPVFSSLLVASSLLGAVGRFEPTSGAIQPYIQDFRLLGPFPFPKVPLGSASAPLGPILEKKIFFDEAKLVTGEPVQAPENYRWLEAHSANGLFRLQQFFEQTEYQVAFADAQVDCPSEMDAALLTEADDGVRVFVNGEPVFTNASAARIQQFRNYSRIHLRQGVNRIVLKLAHMRATDPTDKWNFAIGLRSLDGARAERAARLLLQELTTPIVPPGGSLSFDLRWFENDRKITVAVADRSKAPIREVTLSGGAMRAVNVRDLTPGLYYCTVRESAVNEAVPFFVGSADAAYDEFRRQSARLLPDPAHRPNLQAMLARFQLLLQPSNRDDSVLWQAKVLKLVTEWFGIQDAVGSHREPYRDVAGLHLRGFRSAVDGQEQQYLLHVPKGYRRDQPIPLVVFVPYIESVIRPFVISVPVAEVDVLAMLGRVADAEGLGFLWMNNRGSTVGSDFGESDMFRAMEVVERDYTIDTNRLYLFGAGSGGRDALALASKYPDRFAAVGTMSSNAEFVPFLRAGAPDTYSRIWLTQKIPLNTMSNLRHVPVYGVHGAEDTHLDPRQSVMLHDRAVQVGVPFQLEMVPGGTQSRFPVDPRVSIFEWFRDRRVEQNPDDVAFTTTQMRYNRAYWLTVERLADVAAPAIVAARYRDGQLTVQAVNVDGYSLDLGLLSQKTPQLRVVTNGKVSFEGSITERPRLSVDVQPVRSQGGGGRLKTAQVGGPPSDAFTGPVLVVVGTAGGAQAATVARSAADSFLASWQKRFLVGCRTKLDQDVTPDDIRDYNLVLFGDEVSNTVFASISDKLPFHRDGASLKGPGKDWQGAFLSVQYVFPNPRNPDRYVVIPGDPNCHSCMADANQLSLFAWYDYVVWHSMGDGGPSVVEDIGRFDQNWSGLVTHIGQTVQRTRPN